MDLGLSGKVAVVTGSSRGIGRAIAEALASEGAQVVLNARTEAPLRSATEALTASGARVVGYVADVATRAGATALMERAIAELGGVDVLVNNVGGSQGTGGFDVAS